MCNITKALAKQKLTPVYLENLFQHHLPDKKKTKAVIKHMNIAA